MGLRYSKIRKKPVTFLKLFGVSPHAFEKILAQVRPLWDQEVISKYRRPGRPLKLDIEDIVLILLLYYRSYVTQMFVGFLFGLDDSRVCRLIQKMEPLLVKVFELPQKRVLKQQDIEQLIDATEQEIERPEKNQEAYYSGKKKRHTLKTQIRTTTYGKILHISQTQPGAVHDFALYKTAAPPPKRARIYADSGYQGIDKTHHLVEIPYKKPRKGDLTDDEKEYNQALSKIRVKIENILAQLKVFKILSDRYRNKRLRYNEKFCIIAGINNLKNGFASF